jgi:hypothetical protein
MVVRAEVSSPDLVDLAVAIKYEQDGAVMRREFVRNLRAAVAPAVQEAKSSIMSMPSGGLREKGGGLRAGIQKQIKTQVSLSTRKAKVKVSVKKGKYPRGFNNAPKATQMATGWRHPVVQRPLGKGVHGPQPAPRWVAQIGKPGWFDQPLRSHRARYRAAVQAAMQQTADRIARKV